VGRDPGDIGRQPHPGHEGLPEPPYGARDPDRGRRAEIASSEAFEDLLRATTEDSRVYTHTWKAGDLLMWDNSAAMHRREGGAVEGDRVHRRAVTGGLEVIAA
jgi:hypothetical protein